MRFATTPRWVFIMLIVMGLGFMAGAAAFFVTVPVPTGAVVGFVWLVMGAGMAFFSYRALRHARDEDRIRRTGTPATATMLAAKTTGWVVNGVPQWALRLRVDGYGAPYETQMPLRTYSPPSDGSTFPVRVDPLHKEHVVLTGDALPTPAATAPASTVPDSVLTALRQAGIEIGSVDGGTTTSVNADGSRTITTTTMSIGGNAFGSADAPRDPAETVRLLADLDRMRTSGALGEPEFDALKKRLLGEE